MIYQSLISRHSWLIVRAAMEPQTKGVRPGRALVVRKRVQQGAIAIAVTSAVLGAYIGMRLAFRFATRGFRTARTTYRAATFRLYRRCPDCKRLIRYEARVCG